MWLSFSAFINISIASPYVKSPFVHASAILSAPGVFFKSFLKISKQFKNEFKIYDHRKKIGILDQIAAYFERDNLDIAVLAKMPATKENLFAARLVLIGKIIGIPPATAASYKIAT